MSALEYAFAIFYTENQSLIYDTLQHLEYPHAVHSTFTPEPVSAFLLAVRLAGFPARSPFRTHENPCSLYVVYETDRSLRAYLACPASSIVNKELIAAHTTDQIIIFMETCS